MHTFKLSPINYEYTNTRRHATWHFWRGTGSISLLWWGQANWDSKQEIWGFMSLDYTEILKCYEGVDDVHASTSFEFGLMNELYYQLFREEF